MRDDLHHSFPLNHVWRNAVRTACGASAGWDVPGALERAAWSSGAKDWWDTGWGKELRRALCQPGDMFANDLLRAELKKLERGAPTVAAKRALDCAYSEVLRGRAGPDLLERVVSGALSLSAEDGIENAVARVANEHNAYQARELRKVLTNAMTQCDFRRPPRKRVAAQRPSIAQGLDISLELKV